VEVARLTRPGEVVLLHCTAHHIWPRQRRQLPGRAHRIAFTLDDTMLASAYYLTREGAALMVARWEAEGITFMMDHWYMRKNDRPSWAGTLPVLVLKPDLFTQRLDVPSEIVTLGRSGDSGALWAASKAVPPPFDWKRPLRKGLKKPRRQVRTWATKPQLLSAPPLRSVTSAVTATPPVRSSTLHSPDARCG
jgi:hypothetical protein